jgi:hypothetical protein
LGALAVFAVITTGVAWAAGAFNSPSPQTLFKTHFPADSGAGPIFQHVIPDSVKQVASVEIPKVGPVALWHADTKQGGFCLGLRLSNGDWLGTPHQAGGSPLDGGGSVPGCFPTGVIDGGSDHLEWLENDIDAYSVGGTFWRIRSGVITVPGAVKVTDLTTGKSTDVVDGNVFLLAIEAPDPNIGGVTLLGFTSSPTTKPERSSRATVAAAQAANSPGGLLTSSGVIPDHWPSRASVVRDSADRLENEPASQAPSGRAR